MDEKYLFYIVIAVVLGFTTIITSCAYQSGSCRKEAIKANVNPEHIAKACAINA